MFDIINVVIAMKKDKCPHCLKKTAKQICEHCLNNVTQGDEMSDFRRELRLAIRVSDHEKIEKLATFILSLKKDDCLSTYMLAYLNYANGNKSLLFGFLDGRVSNDLNEIINHALIHVKERDKVQRFIEKNMPSFQIKDDLPALEWLELYSLTEVVLTTPQEKRIEMGKMQLVLGSLLLVVLGVASLFISDAPRYFYTNLLFIIPSVLLARGVVNRFMRTTKNFVIFGLFLFCWFVLTFVFLINLQDGVLNHWIRMAKSPYEFFEFYVKRAL